MNGFATRKSLLKKFWRPTQTCGRDFGLFNVAADVSLLILIRREKLERTHVRCYGGKITPEPKAKAAAQRRRKGAGAWRLFMFLEMMFSMMIQIRLVVISQT